ncbi:unnamed protein product [Schistocephalus solidus]|uniref:Reverse transcriptase domain-containing protein n=1 Tax=Schistocephalus solidus TaxID=70667 RepID=A0A183SVV1_SCHSO|nr:unnamed protein product [Schistocephalus solidus]
MSLAAPQLQEKYRELRIYLYSTSIDLTKAFKTMNREGWWEIMRKFGCLKRFTHMTSTTLKGSRNEVADALYRPSIAHLELSPGIDLAEVASEQHRVFRPVKRMFPGSTSMICHSLLAKAEFYATSLLHPIVPLCHHLIVTRSTPPYRTFLTLGVELLTSWFPTASSGLGCTRTSKLEHGLVSPVNAARFSGTTRPPSAFPRPW